MPRERTAILASLKAKGFQPEDASDHTVLTFEYAGLTRAFFTKVSRGSGYKDYSDDLLAKMSKQLKVTRAFLNGLIDCDKHLEDYVTVLKAQGFVRDSPPTDD